MSYVEQDFERLDRPEPIISKDDLFTTLDIKPHSLGQYEFHHSTARFRTLCCGRRWGKSFAAGNEVTAWLFIPDSWFWICGPTYRLGEKEFRVVRHNLKKLGFWDRKDVRTRYNPEGGDMFVEMPWNTKLEVVSADKPDSLQGEGLLGVCMSEAATHSFTTWRQYIEPTLTDERGDAIFPSTPKGFNWFKGMYDLGMGSDSSYESWRFPTWTNRAKFDGTPNDPEIQRIRAEPDETGKPMTQELFDQEYGALFTSKAGRIFKNFDQEKHVFPFEFNPSWQVMWGIDFGFTNPFVRLEIGYDHRGRWWVFDEYYKSGINTDRHAKILREELRNGSKPPGYHVTQIYADPRQPDQADIFAENGLFCVTEVVPEWQGQEYINRLLGPEGDKDPFLFIHPRCVNLIRELNNLEGLEPTSDKRDAKEGAKQKDNHATDALRYPIGMFLYMGSGEELEEGQMEGDSRSTSSEVESYFSGLQTTTMEGRVF